MNLAALLGVLIAPDPGAVTAAPISELIGQTVTQAGAQLGATRDPAPAVTIVDGRSRVDIYPAEELTRPRPPTLMCDVAVVPPETLAEASESAMPLFAIRRSASSYRRVAAIYVVARDGVVVSVLNPPMRESAPARVHEAPQAHMRRMMQENRDPWLSIAPGRLPLSDGADFLHRRPDILAPEGGILAHACQTAVVVPSPLPPTRDDAGLFQGLALLPFAWRLKGLNSEREANRLNGAALFTTLRPGEPLPGGLSAFLLAHPYVRRHVDPQDPAYSVLVINLGAETSNNLARMNAAALVGVRDDRIVWTGDGEAGAGLGLVSALCIDDRAIARATRPGCTDTGQFSP